MVEGNNGHRRSAFSQHGGASTQPQRVSCARIRLVGINKGRASKAFSLPQSQVLEHVPELVPTPRRALPSVAALRTVRGISGRERPRICEPCVSCSLQQCRMQTRWGGVSHISGSSQGRAPGAFPASSLHVNKAGSASACISERYLKALSPPMPSVLIVSSCA